jgi:hypothetical protein
MAVAAKAAVARLARDTETMAAMRCQVVPKGLLDGTATLSSIPSSAAHRQDI